MSLEKMDELFGITQMLQVMEDIDHQRIAQRPYSHRTIAEYELKGEAQWQRRSSGNTSRASAAQVGCIQASGAEAV